MGSSPKLIIVIGLQGTGKTTVSKKVVEIFDAVLLRTDVIRRELFKERHYTVEETKRVYSEMFERAEESLRERKTVVLDAMFAKRDERIQAKKVADKIGVQFQIVEVVCSEDVIEKRIKARSGDASEATFEIYLKFKNLFELVLEEHITVDNSGSLKDIDTQLGGLFNTTA